MIGSVNTGGGGGSGGTLVVSSPAGVTVIAEKDDKRYTRTANAEGIATFKGLSTGTWSLVMTNGQQTSTPVDIAITADYEAELAFFEAYIAVTYPANSTCTCTDGITTFTDTNDTASTKVAVFTVPYTGTWNVSTTNGSQTDSEAVSITAEGQSKSVTLTYFAATIKVTYPSGSTLTCSDGTTTFTATTTTGSYTFTVPNAGTWTVKSTNGSQSDSEAVSITASGQSKSVTLAYTLIVFNSGDVSAVSGGWGRSESKQSGYIYGECMAGSWSVGSTIYSKPSSYYNSAGTDAAYATYTVYSKKSINVTGYKTLKVTAGQSGPTLRLGTSTTSGAVVSKSLASGTISLDVSSLSGSYYIQFHGGTCNVSKIVFET